MNFTTACHGLAQWQKSSTARRSLVSNDGPDQAPTQSLRPATSLAITRLRLIPSAPEQLMAAWNVQFGTLRGPPLAVGSAQ
jgi:hypothetical protein